MLKVPTRKSDDPTGDESQPTDLIAAVNEEFAPKFDEIVEQMKSLSDRAEEAAKSEAEDAVEQKQKALDEIDRLDEENKRLQAEHQSALLDARTRTLAETTKSLAEYVAAAREPHSEFTLGRADAETSDSTYGPGADNSFFVDAAKSFKNEGGEAWERWQEAMTEKAMTQASGSTGGYLVPPEVSNELLRFREQSNVLRPLLSRVQVNADTLRIAAQTSGLLAGWVAELAEKPESELTFGEISVNVFWKAGMSVVSNQLLRNSNPSIDQLIYSDLGRRLAALEEIAFINGSGVGQPKGILQTPGVLHNASGNQWGIGTYTTADVDTLLDVIVDAITAIYTEYFAGPTGILMHPRDWATIVKHRKEDATAEYWVGPPSSAQGGGRDAVDPLPGYGAAPNPTGRLFGLPVYTTRNVPVNAGAADNETRIIVGAFNEGLILDHAGVTLDSSEHVYFRTNQTIFRAEDAVGFTAARYPEAFSVIGGAGLAV